MVGLLIDKGKTFIFLELTLLIYRGNNNSAVNVSILFSWQFYFHFTCMLQTSNAYHIKLTHLLIYKNYDSQIKNISTFHYESQPKNAKQEQMGKLLSSA